MYECDDCRIQYYQCGGYVKCGSGSTKNHQRNTNWTWICRMTDVRSKRELAGLKRIDGDGDGG